MIIRTEEEFIKAFEPGDVIYWTSLWRDVPQGVNETLIDYYSTNMDEFPDIAHHYNRETNNPILVRDKLRTGNVEYLETMLMTNRVCATTREEAVQGLATLKWLYANDPNERARVAEYWADFDDETKAYEADYV